VTTDIAKGSLKTREDERNSLLDSFTYYLPTSGTGNPGIRGSPNPGTNPGIPGLAFLNPEIPGLENGPGIAIPNHNRAHAP